MKKLITMMLFMMLTMISFGQDNQTFEKREELIKNLYVGVGWNIVMNYNIDSEGNSISDTTYYVSANSAAYTQIAEIFIVYSTENYDELVGFFAFLNDKYLNMPIESSYDSDEYSLRIYKGKKNLMVKKLNTGRDDSYAYYDSLLFKVISKHFFD